jgi:hypothetical protein
MAAPAGTNRIEHELEQAARFRAEGRAGRARVCARRAAGWAIGPTYRRTTGAEPPASAIVLLLWYATFPEAPDPLRRAAGRLTTQVTEDHTLPHPEDPYDDACLLVDELRRSTSDAPAA